MATAVWPLTLPQDPLRQGYEERAAQVGVRTAMDAGPPKVRRRFTAGVKTLRVTMSMTRAEVAIFETFYETVLEGGTLRFEWTHPRTLQTVEFRFNDDPPPSWVSLSENDWRVTFGLEVLP